MAKEDRHVVAGEGKLIVEPRPIACTHCDFSSGQRGMDRCARCDGTGSQLLIKDRCFPNTKIGWEKALEYARS